MSLSAYDSAIPLLCVLTILECSYADALWTPGKRPSALFLLATTVYLLSICKHLPVQSTESDSGPLAIDERTLEEGIEVFGPDMRHNYVNDLRRKVDHLGNLLSLFLSQGEEISKRLISKWLEDERQNHPRRKVVVLYFSCVCVWLPPLQRKEF